MTSDFLFILQWWILFFIIGIIFLPTTENIFPRFFDKGYIFAKIIGIAIISYTVFLLGTIKILPFTELSIFLTIAIFSCINILLFKKTLRSEKNVPKLFTNWKIFLFEEIIFFAGLTFWSYIRGFQPDIHGLEKYMDFGFINSILRSDYFPPKDMWFTPFSINYYYFGHLVTAVLTKATFLPSNTTYNLMLATIFAFTFTCSFSIGANLISNVILNSFQDLKRRGFRNKFGMTTIGAGLLTAFLTTFAGNLHAIYTFFKPYINENPVPFWQLPFSLGIFPNNYWYPNATRFIYNTIHEFPMYSFVVSDLHGHVLDIPFVLLTIAVLLSLVSFYNQKNLQTQSEKRKKQNSNAKFKIFNFEFQLYALRFTLYALLLAFLLAIMYMTNAWDGIIYGLLTLFVFFYLSFRSKNYVLYAIRYMLVLVGFFLFSLPFSLHFKPFVSGIGILCAPESLTSLGKVGPFLMEANHCQKSPWWQMLILHGFFYFWVISFLIFLFKQKVFTFHLKLKHWNFIENCKLKIENLSTSDVFILILILLSTLLIIIPEFIYAKDIYPAHYRANTMFKLVYQAFMMLSISSGYIIVRLMSNFKSQITNYKSQTNWNLFGFWILGFGIFALVAIYPYFAITSYYGNLQTYYGLDGTLYLKRQYPTDYDAINWININIKGQPVILEAQGDSYTDYARISANTGLPTVLGWTVHEWLWRGTYDIPAPRILEVKTLYETKNIEEAKQLLKKYNVSLVFIGDLERQKYPLLTEDIFKIIGKLIYQNDKTKIYKITMLNLT